MALAPSERNYYDRAYSDRGYYYADRDRYEHHGYYDRDHYWR